MQAIAEKFDVAAAPAVPPAAAPSLTLVPTQAQAASNATTGAPAPAGVPWAGREPRRWQVAALAPILQALRRRERTVVTATMGSGKSILAAEVCASGRGRVLVTVPTQRLVEQIYATIQERLPEQVGRYYAEAKDPARRIVVACIDSVPALMDDPLWAGPPALMIIDEAHGSESATVLDAYARMKPERILGFTATPFRAEEGVELSLFDREVFVYSVADALRDGVIVPFRVRHWKGAAEVDLDAACLAMIKEVISSVEDPGPGLVNARSIEDAETFAAALTAAGIPALPVHSRLPARLTQERIEALEGREIDVIVHVNMLAEGVDFPWLRWLCMRRPVRSRVRFCQEVGRVLRAAPGKTEAILLDPHDLLGAFSLSYEAILSGGAEEPDVKPFSRELREARLADAEREENEPPSPKTLAAWRRYLRRVYLSAIGSGLIEVRVKSTAWRRFDPSDKQISAVTKTSRVLSSAKTIPPDHRRMLGIIGEHPASLSRGDCSDFLSLAFAALDARKAGVDFWTTITASEDS